MEWIDEIFIEHSPIQATVILAIIIALGTALGKVRVAGISLGATVYPLGMFLRVVIIQIPLLVLLA